METTCSRCHQLVRDEDCYCPVCGLPQLVYAAGDNVSPEQQERWHSALRDASCVAWQPALRWALLLAVPAGLLSSGISPVGGGMGLIWMTAASVWVVALYLRQQQMPWITLGAGARIGLVTGVLAGWFSFGASGCSLYIHRYFLHQTGDVDAFLKAYSDAFTQSTQQTLAGMAVADQAKVQPVYNALNSWIVSPWGHAGILSSVYVFYSLVMVFCAVLGGVLGARLMGRRRQPEL